MSMAIGPWTAQVNDLIGGWVVTTFPRPMSEHDFNKDGDPAKRGYVIAECMTEEDAVCLARLLNEAGTYRELPAEPTNEGPSHHHIGDPASTDDSASPVQ